jgi:hypothetical protein
MDLIDKSNFVCLKFNDGSLYYGEIAYIDEHGNIEFSLDHIKD